MGACSDCGNGSGCSFWFALFCGAFVALLIDVAVSAWDRHKLTQLREVVLLNAGKEPWAQRALGLKQEQKQ